MLFFVGICYFSSCAKDKDIGKAPSTAPSYPDSYPSEVENYNYVLGTQTIGASYNFTDDTRLVETAKMIKQMGSNILKTEIPLNGGHKYSHQVLEDDDSYKSIMQMDFKYYFFWVYSSFKTSWTDGLSEKESIAEYENMFALADYLLKTFKGTGKEFYLGHWEGDWHLTDTNPDVYTVSAERIKGMIDWYSIRQKAVEDARAINKGSDVKVWHYCEVNRVFDALDKNYDRIVNKVLPDIDVDFVSYSSYDAINDKSYDALSKKLHKALNALEAALKPKEGIQGKRVFIGEYGFSYKAVGQGDQNSRSVMVAKAALEWGCPFCLYWEMYNNEIDQNGNQVGYWMINSHGVKQQIYYTHFNFYKEMKYWVYEYFVANEKLPTTEEFTTKALQIL